MKPTNATAINQAVANAGNRKQLTEKQQTFLQKFIDNECMDAKGCAIAAGYSPAGALQVVRSMKDEILELAEMMMVEDAPRAVMTLRKIMSSDENIPQANNKLTAAMTMLDRTGLGKKEKIDVNHQVSGGIFILPSKGTIPEKEVVGEVIDGD